MNKKVLEICFCLLVISGSEAFAQQLQPLPSNLEALKPATFFSINTENTYRFTDNTKATAAAVLNVIKQREKPALLTAEIFAAAKSHYDIQAKWTSEAAVKKGDILLARFAIRSIYAKQESGEAVIYFFVQQAKEPNNKSIIVDISAGPEWKTVDIPFIAANDMDKGEAAICFSFGALAQKVEIADIQVLNFENRTTLAFLPVTKFSYQGREENAAWRTAALKRIEAIRTAPINITVVDAKGKPVAGAKVEVKMVASAFIWGTSANEALLGNELPDAANYKRIFKEFFNTGVIENGFKWPRWSGAPERKAETKIAFEWLEQNGFRQRGHNLVWPGFKFAPRIARETAEKDTAAFRKIIEEDVRTKMAYTKGRVIAWDVINELVHEKDFYPYLPADISVQWFKLAKQLDPNAQLFINEYGMLNSVASPRNCQQYIDTIIFLRKQGAPIEAIGIQGHVGRQPRNPAQVITDLNLFTALNLPVQITEFDINMPDEALQSDYTRDFLIACYSSPVVTGFTIWGFWEGAHWKKDAAMFRKDWTPKPNAAVWREWVTKKWKTGFTALTNKGGKVQNRGHLGKYEIEVTYNGKQTSLVYYLTKDGVPLKIKLKN